ncbi:MAG: IS1595 family transposase, partial [Methylococcaceae bacterium]|nr:IS1595 family transposase [Methylococcaceae bacterium]
RFNRRFHLETLPTRLLVAAVTIGPRPAAWLRQAEEAC